MPHVHFGIEIIDSILTLVSQDCWMTKIDIKDAYYSVPVLHEKYSFKENFTNSPVYQTDYLGLANLPSY